MLDLNDLGVEEKVLVAEKVPLGRATVQGLCDVIVGLFRGKYRPEQFVWRRGEDLVVDRLVPKKEITPESDFVTPYEMVRQHSELTLLDEGSAVERVFRAAEELHDRNFELTMIVTKNRDSVDEWFRAGKLDAILRVPIAEDSDCPDSLIVFCGSRNGNAVGQIERAIAWRME